MFLLVLLYHTSIFFSLFAGGAKINLDNPSIIHHALVKPPDIPELDCPVCAGGHELAVRLAVDPDEAVHRVLVALPRPGHPGPRPRVPPAHTPGLTAPANLRIIILMLYLLILIASANTIILFTNHSHDLNFKGCPIKLD